MKPQPSRDFKTFNTIRTVVLILVTLDILAIIVPMASNAQRKAHSIPTPAPSVVPSPTPGGER